MQISKTVARYLGRANAKYNLINNGDKVLLGLSGGKDSLALAHALKHMRRVAPFKFSYEAVTIDYGIGQELEKLHEHCEKHEIMHTVIKTSIFELMKEKIRPNSSFCSFCSRMRRGALYSYALANGFNKLALAHHFDDAAESFFMNFMNNGALRSMAPVYRAENGILVIRPFIYVRERQIQALISDDLPIVSEDYCPAKQYSIKMPRARAETKKLLSELEKKNPNLFISLKSAFENVQINSFHQKEFLDFK